MTVDLGDWLGWRAAMAGVDPVTPNELVTPSDMAPESRP
jgi:hypothetical protein